MRTGKRIVSILLVVLMLLTAAPLAGFVGLEIAPKAKALAETGQCGENVYWIFDESTGVLTISGSGAMQDYSGGSPFHLGTVIKAIRINSGVTSIGKNAFSGCKSLTSIEIPNSVTSIGDSAFSDCSSLIGIEIPHSVTSVGTNAFWNCSSLMSIEIPNSVTRIGSGAFCYCRSLSSVTISDNVTSISGRIFECCNLTSVTIPDGVTSIDSSAFKDCSNLASVTIPDSVTSIGVDAFDGCSSLTSVTIPDGVLWVGNCAFYGCSCLKNLAIGSSVKSIGYKAFNDCSKLKNVYYGGSEKEWAAIKIGNENDSLTNATIHFNSSMIGDDDPVESVHIVTYNFAFNGGNSSSLISAEVAEGASVDLTPIATKSGWTFVGWNTNPNATTALTSLIMGNNDVTLYAIFRKNEQPPSGDEDIIEISGALTALTSTGYVVIDDVWWYPYDTSNEQLSALLSSLKIGTKIYCRLISGVIVDCANWQVKNKLVPSVAVINGNDVEYQAETQSYNRNEMELSVNVFNSVSDQKGPAVFDANIAGYDLTFDKIVVSVPDTNLVYFKGGLFGLGKEPSYQISLNTPLAVPATQYCSFGSVKAFDSYFDILDENLVLYVNTSQKWGEQEKDKKVDLTVAVYNGSDLISTGKTTITLHNPDAMKRAAENAEIDKKAKDAARLIDKTTGTLHHEFLSEIFTSDDLKYIETAIKCKIALAAISEIAYKKEDINDKIINRLIEYAGVKKSWIGFLNDADIKLEVEANTEKYGMLKIDFLVPVTFASIGDGNPYSGWSFESSYTVSGGAGKKKVPAEKRSGDITSLFTFADIQTFSDSVQSVALAELESAYNIGYGNDFNKMCEMLFGNTITKILSYTNYKNYKHLMWKMMIYPSTQVDIYCPVNVYVFNADNEQCAAIEDNVVIQECEDIEIKINGDEKHITLYQRGYSIKLIPTADYHMRITIDEYNAPNSLVRSVSFDNLVINPGNLFETDFVDNNIDAPYLLTKNKNDTITSSADVVNMHIPQIVEIVDYDASCMNSGLMHTECLICSETIESVVIPALGHTDENNDGHCDRCGEQMTGGDHCKFCGKIHNGGFFDKLTGFFHKIFAIFKR